LQISAKALSAQFSKFQPKSIARFNDAKAAAILPRCHFASHHLASLLRADKPATRHRQALAHAQSHPAAILPCARNRSVHKFATLPRYNRNTILNLPLCRAVSLKIYLL